MATQSQMAENSTAAAAPPILDCFSCRLIGTGAFAGLGLYSIAMARHYAQNPGLSAGRGANMGIRLVGYGGSVLSALAQPGDFGS